MANYNDSFKASLEAKGYTSSFTDAWNQYLQDNTDIESTVTPDMLAAWLSGKGYTGSVPDMLQQYAEAAGYTSHAEQVIANAFLACYRDVYDFDGVDDRGQIAFKAVNIDRDNVFEFYTPPDFANAYVIVSQNITGTFNSREFQLYTAAGTNGLVVLFGGTASTLYTTSQGLKPSTKYGLRLLIDSADARIYEGGLGGTLVRQTSFVKGTAREPSAVTKIGCNTDNATHVNFFKGVQRDVRVNNFFWPIGERDASIQLPTPSGLGAELITQSVLENPALVGTQWTYLGAGRWQYVGNGSYNSLRFLTSAAHPVAGFMEFEVESISGLMRCTAGTSPATVVGNAFSATGVKRAYYTSFSIDSQFEFARNASGQPASCIVKNISFKPLWTASATELVTNGDFNSGTSGWTTASGGSLSVSSGQATLTTASGQASRFEQNVVLEPLAWYEYSANLISFSGVASARLQMLRGAAGAYRQVLGVNYTSTGRMSVVFQAPASDGIAQISGDSTNAGTVVVDNVSLRKLDSICNPLTLVNTTSERWSTIEVPCA